MAGTAGGILGRTWAVRSSCSRGAFLGREAGRGRARAAVYGWGAICAAAK